MAHHGRLILASASPRRRALLAQAGLTCEVVVSNVAEVPAPGESPEAYCARNAREKALDVAKSRPMEAAGAVVLAADTIVVSPEGSILEKPQDESHAVAMLTALAGRTHRVLTGVCLVSGNDTRVLGQIVVATQVLFRDIPRAEMDAYVASGEPFDKAGSYGIQGRAAAFVRALQGSYTNVVGLPLCEVVEMLRPHLPQE
jgi:septum formation protein